MTTTEELRRLLSERGVRYDVRDSATIKNTYWDDADGRCWGYTSDEGGSVEDRQLFLVHGRMDISPEQVIAATLGAGTCHAVPIYSFNGEFTEYDHDECSYCGDEWGDVPNYCPNCGRKVVDE